MEWNVHSRNEIRKTTLSWETNFILKDLKPEELAVVKQCMVEKTFESNTYLIREGEIGTELYFIEQGQVEVLKNDWVPDQRYRLCILNPGEIIGEMALFGDQRRIASVRTVLPTKLWELSLQKLVVAHPEIASKIAKNLGVLLISRLSTTSQMVVSTMKREFWQARKRSAMSGIAVKVIAAIVFYQVIVQALIPFVGESQFSLVSPLLVVLGGWLCYRLVKQNVYPLKMYAVTLRNWKKSIIESFFFTIPFLLVALLIKLWLIHTVPGLSHAPLFEMGIGAVPDVLSEATSFLTSWAILAYILTSPIQEFIFRGVIQSAMHRFLVVKNRALVSMLITNLIFVQAHFYWNFSLFLLIPGMTWSWLVIRHRTLIGASFSHMLLGAWTFFIVGLNP